LEKQFQMPDLKNTITHWSHHRQLLGKKANSFEQILQLIIGVYSAHPTAALSLFARTNNFDEKAFYGIDENKIAYRVPAMRQSVYWLPKDDAAMIMAATLDAADSPAWEKRYSHSGRKIPPENYADWANSILKNTSTPFTVKELKGKTTVPDDKLKFVLNRMAFERKMLRVGANSLRSNIISYVSTEAWNNVPFENIDAEKAQIWLAKKYLHTFGPVRIKDFQWWAGITLTKAKEAFSAFETIDLGDDLLLLKEDQKAFESFKIPKEDFLDILPQWDSYIMGYAPDGRERFVSEDMQHHIYGKLGATGGNGLGTILVNGKAYGSWNSRFKGSKMEVSLNLFEKTGSKLKKDITQAFQKIALLLHAKSVVFENKP
jgi:DNA glycosylase AlkZ-like